jgi:hypothetical protein
VAAGENIVNVVYSKTLYPITVKYYKDSISVANFIDQVPLDPAPAGTAINNVDLALFVPDGYSTPGVRSGATVVAAGENIVNVVYSKTLHPITVKYYRDSIEQGNYINEVPLAPAPVGTAITGVDLSLFAPVGYSTPGTRSGATFVAAGENIVNVVYSKALFPVVVRYHKDTTDSTGFINQVPLPAAPLGSVIDNVDLTLFAPDGYTIPGTRYGATVVAPGENIVYVLYTVASYPITVKYYKDSISEANYINQAPLPPAPFGSEITGVDLALFAPPEYITPGERSGATHVGIGENVVNVVYTIRTYPITVKYYQDTIDDAGYLNQAPLAPAPLGKYIDDGDVDMTLFAPEGYQTPGVRSGATYVEAKENVVIVLYAVPLTAHSIFVYYYKDTQGGTYLNSDYIETYRPVGSDLTDLIKTSLYAPPGYATPGTITGDLTVKEPYSLVYVTYTSLGRGLPSIPQYPIYVLYYKDFVGGPLLGLDILPAADLGSAIIAKDMLLPDDPNNTAIGIDRTKYAPAGYTTPGALSGDETVKSPMAVVIVVYTQ